jgi:hypothetical protein
MPKEHEQACEVDETEEFLNVELPSSDESAVVLHPGKESLNLPSATIAA